MRRPFGRRKQQLRGIAVLITAVIAMSLLPAPGLPRQASAAPSASSVPSPARSQSASMAVSLSKAAPSVPPTGTMSLTVSVTVRAPVDRLTVRVRVRRPSGHLLYQRTQQRYSVHPGNVSIAFTRPLSDLELKEAAYPVEVYVTGDRLAPVTLDDRLYVVKPGREPLPVAVVARLGYSPMVGPDGRFLADPATSTGARDTVNDLTAMMARSPWLRMSVAFPPLMLDEWRRMSSGFELASDETSTRAASKDSPIAGTYAAAAAALKRSAADGRLEILNVPFADPDLFGLRSIGGMRDLALHYDRGFSAYQASLGTTPSAGTAVAGDSVPESALPVLKDERIGWVLLRPSSITVSKVATPLPGVYALADSPARGIVVDERASSLLAGGEASTGPLLDYLFSRMVSQKDPAPEVLSVGVGDGGTSVAALEAALVELGRSGWVRFRTTGEAAEAKPLSRARLRSAASPGPLAPSGYWAAVAEARRFALALVGAVSERDDAATSALYDSLLAESRLWAGATGGWTDASRGRAFADAALRSSRGVLDGVSVTTQTITLSGTAGKIPLVVRNGSDKTLSVDVVCWSQSAHFPSGTRIRTSLRPADNYVTVPIELGSGLIYDRVHLSVVSGDVTLASTIVDVHASYLDRLALVGTVVVVLAVLLVYIRRKVRGANADT